MTSLFEEADIDAAALRRQPKCVDGDLAWRFRRIQRRHLPHLSIEVSTTRFEVWMDRHKGQRGDGAERAARAYAAAESALRPAARGT